MRRGWRVLVVGCGWIAWKVHLPYLAGLWQDGELGSLSVADAATGLVRRRRRSRLLRQRSAQIVWWVPGSGMRVGRRHREPGVVVLDRRLHSGG
jgi:hypothetical protein